MKQILCIILFFSVITPTIHAQAQGDFPIFPIDFGITHSSKLTDRTPVTGYQFAAEQGDKVAIAAMSAEETLTFLDLQLLDSNWNLIHSQQTTPGADPAYITSEIPVDGIYVIRISKGSAVGGGEFRVRIELLPPDAEIVQSSAHGMGMPVIVDSDQWELLKGDFNRCHNGYTVSPEDSGVGIVWYRNPSDMVLRGRPEFNFPGRAGAFLDRYDVVQLATPGAIDFVMIPQLLLRAAGDPQFNLAFPLENIDDETSDKIVTISLDEYEYYPSPSILTDMAVDIELIRHFSEKGEAPFFHHQIELRITNVGEYDIRGRGGRIAFAVYNTSGELVDMGGYVFTDDSFEVGTTRTISLQSVSQSGNCVQPYDPQGHEIWIGVSYNDSATMTTGDYKIWTSRGGSPNVFNAFEVFPIGTVPFELPN